MGKRLALAAAGGIVLAMGLLPGYLLQGVERCQVLSPQTVSYRPSIRCEGTVYPEKSCQLLSAGLYRIEERLQTLGDPVGEGEVLAVLVPAAGDTVLYRETRGSFPTLAEEDSLSALAQGYGLTAGAQPELMTLLSARESGEEERVEVCSPFPGVLTGEVPVPGSVVRPGEALCSVEGRGDYYALLTVGEKDAAKLAVGNEVTLTGEGVGLVACSGVLTKIYPGTRKEYNGTTAQRVVDIEVSIRPGSQEIRPGFTVKAQIFTGEADEMLLLPYEAVRQAEDNTEYVIVAGEHHLERRTITTGRETLEGIEVVSGVSHHELVAIPEGGEDQPAGRYILWRERG